MTMSFPTLKKEFSRPIKIELSVPTKNVIQKMLGNIDD